jgi:CHAD domain-containing protein
MNEFVADLRFRHQEVWRVVEGNDTREQPSKLTTYQARFAFPFIDNARSAARVLKYLYLNFSEHVMRIVSRFCLWAHTLRVKSGLWQDRDVSCNHCDCQDIQDEKLFNFIARMPVLVLLERSTVLTLEISN